jgi:hypothetical protein
VCRGPTAWVGAPCVRVAPTDTPCVGGLVPKAYRVFNKSSGLVEVSSDVVFDETNGSPREQVVDLDDVDEEVPTTAIRTMAIGDVRPHEQKEQDQPSSSTMVQPPTQDDEQVHQDEACD